MDLDNVVCRGIQDPWRGGQSKTLPERRSRQKIDEVFEQEFIKLVPLDVEVAKFARKLLRQHSGLKKRPDAIHLASALRWPVDVMHTYDGNDLLHLDGKMKGKTGSLLRIAPPDDPPDGPLFQASG